MFYNEIGCCMWLRSSDVLEMKSVVMRISAWYLETGFIHECGGGGRQ